MDSARTARGVARLCHNNPRLASHNDVMNVLALSKDMTDLRPRLGGRYCRIGATCALAAGATFGLITWVIADDAVAATSIGAIFGLMAGSYAAVATWMGERRIRARGYLIERSPSVRQELDVTVDVAPNELFEVCRDVLAELDDVSVGTGDAGQLRLIGEIGPSWRSFGEHLQIVVREIAPSRSRVWILSRPTHRAALIDYGKNLENVISIRDALQASLERSGQSSLVRSSACQARRPEAPSVQV